MAYTSFVNPVPSSEDLVSFIWGGSIAGVKDSAVKFTGPGKVDVTTAVTEVVVGYLKNAPAVGGMASVLLVNCGKPTFANCVSGQSSSGLVAGTRMSATTAGQLGAITTTTGTLRYACAIVVEPPNGGASVNTASGDKILVLPVLHPCSLA